MKRLILGFASIVLAAATVFAQSQPAASDTSLGDVARQLKAQKAKEPKAAKVFTNDSLAPAAAEVKSNAPAKPAGDSPADKGKEAPAPAKPAADSPEDKGKEAPAAPHDEKYYRAQMATLQGNLDTHQRELDVLQQKLGQNQTQYYNDPQQSLMQQYSREDVNKLTASIDAKKQQIADDEKAIEDLREQLRRDGGDPDWLR